MEDRGDKKEDFLKRVNHHNIPSHLIDIVWDSMITMPKASLVRTELQEIFSYLPTFSALTTSIASRPGKTIGGMSGLTYSMMKAWFNDFKQLVYNNLAAHWGSPIRDWMKWRWLCPIQKTEDSKNREKHRPVMLVLVLRKCWIGLIIYKITQVWNKHDILHPSQHGFKSKKGTDTALLGLQSIFEQNARTHSPHFLSSWDISKAFDSLSKNVLRFSWIHLGVSAPIAVFLVSLDELGHTVVRTNHSRET